MQTWFRTVMAIYFVSTLYFTLSEPVLSKKERYGLYKESKQKRSELLRESGFSPGNFEPFLISGRKNRSPRIKINRLKLNNPVEEMDDSFFPLRKAEIYNNEIRSGVANYEVGENGDVVAESPGCFDNGDDDKEGDEEIEKHSDEDLAAREDFEFFEHQEQHHLRESLLAKRAETINKELEEKIARQNEFENRQAERFNELNAQKNYKNLERFISNHFNNWKRDLRDQPNQIDETSAVNNNLNTKSTKAVENSNKLRQLLTPTCDGSIVTIGDARLDVHLVYLHRVLNEYYYEMLTIDIASLPDREERNKYYKTLNGNMNTMLSVIMNSRQTIETIDLARSNYFLSLLKNITFYQRNNNYPRKRYFPRREEFYVGRCAKYISYHKIILHDLHPMEINSGKLNIPKHETWLKYNCTDFYESANTHVAAEDDNLGVNVGPPFIIGKYVRIRGSEKLTENDLYGKKKLLNFYKCVLEKIDSIPGNSERLCYFNEFHRRMLRFIRRYRKRIGRQPWPKIDNAAKWFQHRNNGIEVGQGVGYWGNNDRQSVIDTMESILTEGTSSDTILSIPIFSFKLPWQAIVQLPRQKLVSLLGCILIMFLLLTIAGCNLILALQRRRAMKKYIETSYSTVAKGR